MMVDFIEAKKQDYPPPPKKKKNNNNCWLYHQNTVEPRPPALKQKAIRRLYYKRKTHIISHKFHFRKY